MYPAAVVRPLNPASSAKSNATVPFCGVRRSLVPMARKAAFRGSKASDPASQMSAPVWLMVWISKLPLLSNTRNAVGESLPMKKSLLGITMDANVKY